MKFGIFDIDVQFVIFVVYCWGYFVGQVRFFSEYGFSLYILFMQVYGFNMIFEDEDDDEDEDKEVNMEKLCVYEKNKFKYYYVVVECDLKEIVNYFYMQCDGMEFEWILNIFDLWFIFDDMMFVREFWDIVKEVWDGYKVFEFEIWVL